MKNMYILQVTAQSEEKVAKVLKNKTDPVDYEIYLPTIVKPYTKKEKDSEGKEKRNWYKRLNLCFEGYVFIESNLSAPEVASELGVFVKELGNTVRFLYYGDDPTDMSVRANEKKIIREFMDNNHCIGVSTGVRLKAGDRVKIIDGPLVGKESMIEKVLDNKHRAILKVDFMGAERRLDVMIDVLIGNS